MVLAIPRKIRQLLFVLSKQLKVKDLSEVKDLWSAIFEAANGRLPEKKTWKDKYNPDCPRRALAEGAIDINQRQ